MHVGHFAVGEPHVLLLPTGLYYSACGGMGGQLG